MYHQTMTGCKRSHSSKIIIETAVFQLCQPHCDLDLSDSKSICLCATLGHNAACATLGHNAACATLGHNAALQYHVLLHKVQQSGRYCMGKYWLKFWTFIVTLTLNTATHYFHWTLWLITSTIYLKYTTQVWLQIIINFRSRYGHILIIHNPPNDTGQWL